MCARICASKKSTESSYILVPEDMRNGPFSLLQSESDEVHLHVSCPPSLSLFDPLRGLPPVFIFLLQGGATRVQPSRQPSITACIQGNRQTQHFFFFFFFTLSSEYVSRRPAEDVNESRQIKSHVDSYRSVWVAGDLCPV